MTLPSPPRCRRPTLPGPVRPTRTRTCRRLR